MKEVSELSRDDLLKLLEVNAKNWIAHDGCWFLAVEEKYGLETAMELDTLSWQCFAPIEAERIKNAFGIPDHGGLPALEQVWKLRMYGLANKLQTVWLGGDILELHMIECRVQSARRRKGLPDFPCKRVAAIGFPLFAKSVDPAIHTECLACPPDPVGEGYCRWRYTLKEGD